MSAPITMAAVCPSCQLPVLAIRRKDGVWLLRAEADGAEHDPQACAEARKAGKGRAA